MHRIWIIAGALVIWAIVYQGFFRYEYTTDSKGYAIKRYDRLNGTSCGIPECLPATPTPIPTATEFEPLRAYEQRAAQFTHEAHEAVALVRKTQIAQELEHSRGAEKFKWTVEWSDQVAGSLFALHDPAERHALPLDKRYIDSLARPAYHEVKLVCFCNAQGAGYRWEVHLDKQQIIYVNDNPRLEKKYALENAS
jgi:hypothetical protein